MTSAARGRPIIRSAATMANGRWYGMAAKLVVFYNKLKNVPKPMHHTVMRWWHGHLQHLGKWMGASQSKHSMNQITHQVDGMWPLPSDSSIAHCGPKFFLNWLVSFYRCLWGLKAQLYSSKNSSILTKKRFSGIRWLDPGKVEISLLFGRLLLPSVYWENKTPACPS